MYELIQAASGSYYIDCPAKIGLVRLDETHVCLIDSGSDKDAGKKVRKILEQQGWTLTAIYNTHSHADHTGGNQYLQNQTGCKVFAPGIERDFTCHPILEPAFLYGGFPHKALRHKFLLAQNSDAQELTAASLPEGLSVLELPGHSFQMVGFRTRDDVVYLADCLSSRETLDKYGIGFLWDVQASLDTLERVKGLRARLFVPSHAPAREDVKDLAEYNIQKIREAAETILWLCREPVSFETLLQDVFNRYGLTMNDQQYVLIGSTVRSYLAWLLDAGRVGREFQNNRLLWRAAE